jgi:hypothetical protein
MGSLIICCPTTRFPLEIGIDDGIDSLAQYWTKIVRLRCPHCKGRHEVKVRDVVFANEREREIASAARAA